MQDCGHQPWFSFHAILWHFTTYCRFTSKNIFLLFQLMFILTAVDLQLHPSWASLFPQVFLALLSTCSSAPPSAPHSPPPSSSSAPPSFQHSPSGSSPPASSVLSQPPNIRMLIMQELLHYLLITVSCLFSIYKVQALTHELICRPVSLVS